MEARKEHRVPLSIGAIRYFKFPRVAGNHLVFPGQQSKRMSDSFVSLRTSLSLFVVVHSPTLKDFSEQTHHVWVNSNGGE